VSLCLYSRAVALPRSGALILTRRGFEGRHAWITRHWNWDKVIGFGPQASGVLSDA
jgi:hypothetical protein